MSGTKPDLLALRKAFTDSSEAPISTDVRIDADEIWDACANELSAEETAAWIDRTIESPGVAEAWMLARELQFGSPEAAKVSSWRPRFGGPTVRWLGWAASALLAVGGAQLWLRGRTAEAPPAFRSVEGATISARVPDGTPLPRHEFWLKWTALEDPAWTYRVLVGNEALETIAEIAGLSETDYRVAPETLAGTAAGSTLYWRVEASHPDGRRVASPTLWVRLE